MSVANTMNSKRATDEVRHAHDDLEYFYLEAKRNKRLAKWAAKKLDIDKKEYFLELISCDLSTAGPKPVINHIYKDFKHADLEISEEKIWDKLREYEKEVLRDMLDDHAKRIEEDLKNKKKKKKKK